jgi:mitogen-activated protein kinase kinase
MVASSSNDGSGSRDDKPLNDQMQSLGLNASSNNNGSSQTNDQQCPPPPVAPTSLPANVQARIQAFQSSRRNRSNSASTPPVASATPPLPSYSQPGSPNNHNNPLAIAEENSGSQSSTPGFGGALSFAPAAPAAQLRAKQPSLSQRRGTPKLNTEGLNLPGSAAPPSSAPATNNPASSRNAAQGGSQQSNQLPQGTNVLSNYKKYIDVKTGSLTFAGKASLHSQGIDFSSGSSFRVSLDEFEPLGELGRGNYGTVTKVYHRKYDVVMAMKEIRLELDEAKFTQIIMELEILHKCASPYIVDFYGAFFAEGAVYVCMEYMDGGSLDKIYAGGVEEQYLAKITEAVVHGLKQLKDEHNIIHRDVKPTNILVSTTGKIKLCDFGVSGNLVASMAKTNIGCQSYMAPERIRSTAPAAADAMTYTVHSDIWSLGLSILETAKGSYPYPPETYGNIFSQLSAIVDGDPPSLPEGKFSPEARDFVDQCLNKVPRLRPSYSKLLAHPWLQKYRDVDVDLGKFVREARERKNSGTGGGDAARPALHNGRAPTRA